MWNDALPRQGITNWQTFYASVSPTVATTTNSFQSWTKPAGCSWIYIFCIAAGGGGGSDALAGTRAGGGGGAGGITSILMPAFMVPDILYVRPGVGGIGGSIAGGITATAGETSYVSMFPNTTTSNLILSANGGGAGTATTGGGGGASATLTPAIVGVSLIYTNNGLTGRLPAIGSNLAGSNAFLTEGSLTTAGAGGGNGTGAGGNVTDSNGLSFTSILGGAGSGGNGNPGFKMGSLISGGFKQSAMIFSGGSGGGGSGGNGGAGSYGGGGGGGGNGGRGGNGGDAFILVGAF